MAQISATAAASLASSGSVARKAPLAVVVLAGCVIAMITFGTRSSFGLFTLPVSTDLGLSREDYAFAMAIQNLVWGLAQPFAGGMADRFGTARTLAIGGLIYAGGLALMSVSGSAGMLTLSAGIVTGVGVATASFGVVMAAFGRAVPPEKRSFYFGIATAASSLGQFVFAPLGQAFITNFGWHMALLYLAGLLLLVVPLSAALTGRSEQSAGPGADLKFMQALAQAFGHGSYRLLLAGFFVCGFHLAFVTVHFPAYLVECNLSPAVGSWALALIGLFNVAGSLLAGYLGGRLPKQLMLAFIYFARAIAIALFVFLPVTETSTYIFAATLGLLWLATVPLTAGLVTIFFGARYMGMLYGIAFLSHQLGSFVGVWLGGYVYDFTGSYNLVWYLGILLGLASAIVHLPIREQKSQRFGASPIVGVAAE